MEKCGVYAQAKKWAVSIELLVFQLLLPFTIASSQVVKRVFQLFLRSRLLNVLHSSDSRGDKLHGHLRHESSGATNGADVKCAR